jgi:hypothetical protein
MRRRRGPLRGSVELPKEVGAETKADRMAKRHRQFARELLEMEYGASRVRTVAVQAIRAAGRT